MTFTTADLTDAHQDVVFTPGDYLYADEDGIVVSARAL
jgi:regulator of RNase E activity RraA